MSDATPIKGQGLSDVTLSEITETEKDTPQTVRTEQEWPRRLFLALAVTPILTAPTSGFNVHGLVYDQTAVIEGSVLDELAPELFDEFIDLNGEPGHETEAEAANRTRLELLAREFVGNKLSTEEQARLAIVSERVRRLIPGVTVEDFEAIETVIEDLKSIEAEDNERRRRLGIS